MSMLIILMGLPGTGKTSIAKKISQKLNASLIDNDEIKDKIVPQLLGEEKFRQYLRIRKRFPFYIRIKVYESMLSEVKKFLNKNKNVVCAGSFYSKRLRRIFYDFLINQDIKFYIIKVICPEHVLKKRFSERQLMLKEKKVIATWEIYKKEKKLWQPIEKKHIRIDSSQDINGQIDKALKEIK